ncbi:MAG: FAD/NAD(P)-binding protein [Acidimicrobiia bacterium]
MTVAPVAQPTVDIPEPMLLRPFEVTAIREETIDTATIDLAAADGGPPVDFLPGQFTMMYVFGIGEVPISICGDPEHPQTLKHTVRSVGAVTNAICSLAPGDTIGIRGPYGTAWPVAEATGRDIVIVAGGIGLAPVRPAIYSVLSRRSSYKSLSVIYGARTPEDLLFGDEIQTWRGRFDVNVQVTVDRGGPGWMGDVGVVTPLLNRCAFSPANTTAIVCGPEIMMRVVATDLISRGVSSADVFVSLERNMKCGIGFCGHCQIGSHFVCKDGPVIPYAEVAERLTLEEL